MQIRLSSSRSGACRAFSIVPVLLAVAALGCLALSAAGIHRWHEEQHAARPVVSPVSIQITAAAPRWQADLHTALNATCYLLDPRV